MPCEAPNERLERPNAEVLHRVFPGDPLAVRAALAAAQEAIAPYLDDVEDRGTLEIVLAEVLNNIVEHAYRTAPGEIDLRIALGPAGLEVCIVDHGSPLPGGRPPRARLPQRGIDHPLPEGGFGWGLIRALSSDLRYRREGGRNLLCFRLPLERSRVEQSRAED